ncbi:MAG TPA: RNA 2',3'-cyclic phosphodiesterase, partial [Rectinemataceae bacterium]|nr:RNA 2',3'-cyclic phosphodiesterase [Rectinemataceae bacterium]
MRCFVALSLPDPARAALSGLAGALAREWPGLSWTNSEGYHLTLAFLGEIDERGLACAGAALARLDEAAFPFRFSALGGFPPRGPWRVLYLGIDDTPAGAQPSPARRIYASFNEALAAEASERGLGRLNAEWGPAGGGRDFVPHITLARLPERR